MITMKEAGPRNLDYSCIPVAPVGGVLYVLYGLERDTGLLSWRCHIDLATSYLLMHVSRFIFFLFFFS
jgi:hypothetical protein